jgi:signal transduction histidine kinase
MLRQASEAGLRRQYTQLAQGLGGIYERQGGWDGVAESLLLAQALQPPDRPPRRFILRDTTDGRLVFPAPAPGQAEPAPAPADPTLFTVEVLAGDRPVGRLEVLPAPPPPGLGAADRLAADLTRLVLLGTILGVVVSLALARWVTAPLERLATAADALAAGRWGQRVPESGSAEVRATARAFNNMAAALEWQETLRQHMVADTAHELRTPLTVLQGTLHGMLDGVFALDRAELARLLRQVETLGRLVEDLHELALAEAQQLRLVRDATDPRALLEDVAEELAPLAAAQEVALVVQSVEELPPVSLDRDRMAQVLRNLVVNALRHTPSGGRVTLAAAPLATQRPGDGRAAPGVAFTVTDTGEGIAPADLPFVFDRFFRADRSRRRETGGAGLGLAIARAIVELHGGSISAKSPGTGGSTTFTVSVFDVAPGSSAS